MEMEKESGKSERWVGCDLEISMVGFVKWPFRRSLSTLGYYAADIAVI